MTDSRRPRRRIAGERRPRVAPTESPVAVLTRPLAETEAVPPATPDDVLVGDADEPTTPADGVATASARGVPTWTLLAIAVLLAAVLAYDLIFWAKLDQNQAQAAEQRESVNAALTGAPAQAERAAEQILAYRYDHLQADADAAKDFMTTDYAQSYQATVDDLLAEPASQVKAQVTATVKESGVSRVAPGEVDVLLFVDQTSTTTLKPEPQTALNRVVLTMVRQNGRWLVDEITAL